jgi:hypothetical protein
MDEEAVVDFLQEVMEKKLLGANASRTFYTQATQPQQSLSIALIEPRYSLNSALIEP